MGKVSRDTATRGGDFGPVTDRSEDLDGYTIGFTEFRADIDGTPLVRGLPDDRCQCPHWGYVFSGKLVFEYPDRTEEYEAGDAFYAPPGHVPAHHGAGTEVLMFSPADELKKTEEVIMRNMQAMQTP